MKFMSQSFLGVFIICFCSSLFAQDSTVTSFVSLFETKDTVRFSSIDLDDFHNYRYKSSPFNASSGNIGLPMFDLSSIPRLEYNGFFQGFSSSLLTIDDLRFYQQEKDITTLKYINGANSEQYFNVFHSNQFGKGLNLSFDYNRIISEGFYSNQLTDNTHFNTTLNYLSRSGNYDLKAAYLISNLKVQENGGINFSDSTSQDLTNPNLLPLNLFNASHKLRSQTVLLNQSLVLKDSSFLKQIKLYHHSDISWSWKWYKDQGGQTLYDEFYLDSTQTFDSIHYSKFKNSVGISILDDFLRFGYEYEYHDYFQTATFDTLYVSQFLSAKLIKRKGKFYGSLDLQKGVSGFNQDDHNIKLEVDFRHDSLNSIVAVVKNSSMTPYYWMNRFSGNHVFYDKPFEQVGYSFLDVLFKNERYHFNVGLSFHQYSNFIFYNFDAVPFQTDENVNRFHLKVYKEFKLGRFRFTNDINYQNVSSTDVLPLPQVFTAHSLVYRRSFFMDKLFTQFGCDLRYIGSYEGYGFFPESGAFILQDDRKLGDFVYLDLFVKFRIQHVRVFAKMENILGDQFSSEGMMINNYPIPGRAFKIGVSWTMFN